MRKTGTRLLAVLAAVSMTVSLFPVNAVTAAQTDKAQSVQAADSLKKASKAPVTFSEASGTYKDAFSLKLQGADTDTAIYYTTDGSDPSDPDNTARIAYADSGISLHMVAAEVGFSPNHFSTVFSQETGQTFVEYLTAVRIEAAKHLLTKGNSRMSDIAFDVGYQDSHYFSYLFKKHVGVSPREYRSRSEEG